MHTRIPQAKRFWTSICRSILWAICGSVSTLISFTVHSMNRTFLILGSPKYRFKSIFLFASGPLLGGVMPKRKGCGPPSLVLDRVPGIASIDFLGCSGFEHAIWKQDGKCQSSIKRNLRSRLIVILQLGHTWERFLVEAIFSSIATCGFFVVDHSLVLISFLLQCMGTDFQANVFFDRFEMKPMSFNVSDGKFAYQMDLPVPLQPWLGSNIYERYAHAW